MDTLLLPGRVQPNLCIMVSIYPTRQILAGVAPHLSWMQRASALGGPAVSRVCTADPRGPELNNPSSEHS